ncbi:unnamed protein product [marine sediment metagenome]|uniref:Uncharacterized protein n=1 Tax=marine sediment metagenome TaxID=412755 RepID=X1K905_9ZZZZ
MLSNAEYRSLKGGRGLSNNYRRLLSVRISKKLSRIIALLTDPKFAPYLDRLETSGDLQRLAEYLARHRVFRESFISHLVGFSDQSPVIGVSKEDSDNELFYG